jgi:hypothetical protein
MRCCHGKSKNKTKREKELSEWDLTGDVNREEKTVTVESRERKGRGKKSRFGFLGRKEEK